MPQPLVSGSDGSGTAGNTTNITANGIAQTNPRRPPGWTPQLLRRNAVSCIGDDNCAFCQMLNLTKVTSNDNATNGTANGTSTDNTTNGTFTDNAMNNTTNGASNRRRITRGIYPCRNPNGPFPCDFNDNCAECNARLGRHG
ncbi:hypothetical protein FQN57_000477 [Myotisia sp. PD_48]|nr:hypothetical protein FQN57_000477 [Myotisia sp. PD_48]